MLKEFRDFFLRGNLIQLAVAFVTGCRFCCRYQLVREELGDADHRGDRRQAQLQRPHLHDPQLCIHLRSIHHRRNHVHSDRTAVFFFIVKPVDMITKRRQREEEETEEVSDEERRHQELLAALQART